MAQKDYDDLFKILLIGDSAVGKSSLLMRFTEAKFTPNFISTIGIDFKAKTVNLDQKRIKLQVWDTAGQERFRTITTAYFRSAVGIVLVYDVTNADSFQNLNLWIKAIEMHGTGDVVLLLVGNKIDVVEKIVVDRSRGEELARQLNIKFFETSAKTGHNIDAVFEGLARDIMAKLKANSASTPAPSTTSNNQSANQGIIKGSDLALSTSQQEEKSSCCGGDKAGS